MNEFIESFDNYQKRLIDKQKTLDHQRTDIHHSINRAFNKIFEQLIEIRRFCRNDLEQQTINAQIELQQMLDMIQYMRTKTMLYYNHKPELVRSFQLELDAYENRLAKMNLSSARDLDNLSSYLTSSFSSIRPSISPTDIFHEQIQSSPIKETPTSPSHSQIPISTANELTHFKFGPSIVLAYPCDMIASNGRTILSYVIEKNYLNFSTISGVHLSSRKVHRLLTPVTGNNVRLWDLAWCPWSKFYLIVGNLGLYSLCYPYDTNPFANEHLPQVTRLVSFHGLTCQHVRISSHELGWFIYMIEHQNVSLDLYDRRSGQRLRHFDNSLQHDCLPLGFHGFCLNKNLFAIVKKIEVLSTINNRHQIENEQNVEIYFYDLNTMLCIQQMSLCHCSNVYDIKCCYEKNYFFILAEPMQLILVDLNTNEFIRKKLLDEGKHLCMINDHEVFILRSECSIQTLQYRNVR